MILEKAAIESIFIELNSADRKKMLNEIFLIVQHIVSDKAERFSDEENSYLKEGLALCSSAKNFRDGIMLHMFSSNLRGISKNAEMQKDEIKEKTFDAVAFMCRLYGYVNDDRIQPPYLGGIFRVLIESILALNDSNYTNLVKKKIMNRE